MAGMRALGRVYNVVPGASGQALSFKNCSGIGYVAENSGTTPSTLAFTCATSYGASYVAMTPAAGFGNPAVTYQGTAPAVVAWTKQTAVWNGGTLSATAAAGGQQNTVTYVDLLCSELADTYDYVKVTAANCTLTAIQYDLTVQRSPENLQIPGA